MAVIWTILSTLLVCLLRAQCCIVLNWPPRLNNEQTFASWILTIKQAFKVFHPQKHNKLFSIIALLSTKFMPAGVFVDLQGTMIINIGLSPSEGVMVIYPQIRSMSLCLNDGCTWYMARPNTHQSCQSKNRKWKWKQ